MSTPNNRKDHMSYIVTTRSTGRRSTDNPLGMWAAMARQGALRDEIVSRVAVATLDEARNAVAGYALASTPFVDICAKITPRDGGTVGPLPDGTVIQVELAA